jgi:hypothetical protein
MKRYQRADGLVGSQVDDSFVILNIDTGTYVALNATATAIWECLATPRSTAEIVDALLSQFAVERPACEAGVTLSLEQMMQLRLLTAG